MFLYYYHNQTRFSRPYIGNCRPVVMVVVRPSVRHADVWLNGAR